MYHNFKLITKIGVNCFFKSIPFFWIVWLIKNNNNHYVQTVARLGLWQRDVIIQEGAGKNLKINIGMSNADYALGINEIPVQEMLQKILQAGSVFYDVGANVGFFSLIASRLVGKTGVVYAFEPEKENLQWIKHNIEINKLANINVMPIAVSDSVQKRTLIVTDYSGGHTLLENEVPVKSIRNRILVESVSIDELVKARKILPPSMVKIDVEGGELDVLKGMKDVLRYSNPVVLYEVDGHSKKTLTEKQNKIEEFLREQYYTINHLKDSYTDGYWYVSHAIAYKK